MLRSGAPQRAAVGASRPGPGPGLPGRQGLRRPASSTGRSADCWGIPTRVAGKHDAHRHPDFEERAAFGPRRPYTRDRAHPVRGRPSEQRRQYQQPWILIIGEGSEGSTSREVEGTRRPLPFLFPAGNQKIVHRIDRVNLERAKARMPGAGNRARQGYRMSRA